MKSITLHIIIILISINCIAQNTYSTKKENDTLFHFTVLSDLHLHRASDTYVYEEFKENAIPAIINTTKGVGNFMISIGDNDPFTAVRRVVIDSLGNDFRFYTAIGNHDVGKTNNHYVEYPEDNWCNAFDIILYNKDSLKNIVNWGPETRSLGLNNLTYEKDGIVYESWYDNDTILGSKYTTYSFDENNSHYIILDMYSGYNNSLSPGDGEISDTLFNWLEADLKATDKENIFVFGHEPISTSETRMWKLLKQYGVIAYFSGHTHEYEVNNVDGVWNLNPSSTATSGDHYFFKIFIQGSNVELKSYKHVTKTEFVLVESILLKGDIDR